MVALERRHREPGRHAKPGKNWLGQPKRSGVAGEAGSASHDTAAGQIPGPRAASAAEIVADGSATQTAKIPNFPYLDTLRTMVASRLTDVTSNDLVSTTNGHGDPAEGHQDLPGGVAPFDQANSIDTRPAGETLFRQRERDLPRAWQVVVAGLPENSLAWFQQTDFPAVTAISESTDMQSGNPSVNKLVLRIIASSSFPLTVGQIESAVYNQNPYASGRQIMDALKVIAPLEVRPKSAGAITDAILALRDVPPNEEAMIRDIVQAGIEEDANPKGPLLTRLYYREVPDLPANR